MSEYSRIIIVDFVLADTNVPRMQSAMDIQMMSIGAGVERSKSSGRIFLPVLACESMEFGIPTLVWSQLSRQSSSKKNREEGRFWNILFISYGLYIPSFAEYHHV